VPYNVAATHLACNQGRRGVTTADWDLVAHLREQYGR
jgi:hypothetical protein